MLCQHHYTSWQCTQSCICSPDVRCHPGLFTSAVLSPQDMERFRGKIIPARMLYDKTVLKDQRVLVLGGGKTSCGPLSLSPAGRAAAEAALHTLRGPDC